MIDSIQFVILLLIVMVVAYGRLRGHIKSLEQQITAQRESQASLREANRELQAELRRVERRIDLADPNRPPPGEPVVVAEEEKPVVLPPVNAPASPPPLPVSNAAVREHPAPVWEPDAAGEDESPDEPAFFSRIPWRDILKRLHLLPPGKSGSGESAESQLAAWWVTRIGLVLLIIAAVFFGIYVSQRTPPWLRVMTLGLVSFGTIGLGSRMKEKLDGFGRAIIGGGFALLYFTAFAAFALQATKVIDSPAAGVAAQFAALVMAISWSMLRGDKTVATLTLFLGFVSCGFSHSHDLDRFALLGLVLLAATGSFLFATRGWLVPFITALGGSWLAFGWFALSDWQRGDSAAFPVSVGTLLLLTVLFEAGSLVCAGRGLLPPGDRLRRWLILSNTTAAAVLGYAVTRVAHPDRLAEFYFILAGLYGAFTAIHHFRTTDRAVTESLFLKTSALSCLGFAAAFSGPVRWLSIAFQAFALLWTARRSGSRWIALGFVVVLAASIGWFWHDLVADAPASWRWLDAFRIAGGLYLVFLTVQLGLHSRWFPGGIGGTGEDHGKQAGGFRGSGAVVIGLSALALAFSPWFPGHSDPVWFLLLLSLVIGLVSPVVRNAVPCVAAALPLVSTYGAYAVLRSAGQATSGLLLGVVLVILAFGLAETIRRFWPGTASGASFARTFVLLAGLATLLPFSGALCGRFSFSGNTGIGVFALFPVVACAVIFSRCHAWVNGGRSRASVGFQIAVGVLVVMGGMATCELSGYFPGMLALAGVPLLVLGMRVRARNVALAGMFPVLAGFFALWQSLRVIQPGDIFRDSINLAIVLVISAGLAVILWRRITARRLRKTAVWCDAALHGLGIFTVHLFCQKHLGEGPDFAAAGLLGVGLFAISRRFPFRVLGFMSWLPVALACLSSILSGNARGCDGGEVWFWVAGLLVLVHLLAANRLSGSSDPVSSGEKWGFGFPGIIPGISVLAWSLVSLSAAEDPWQPAALTGVALLCSALWRWRSVPLIGYLGLGPLVLGSCMAAAVVLGLGAGAAPASLILTSVLLCAAGLAANGIIMASAVRRILARKITPRSVLPWLHAGGALLLAFAVFGTERLVSESLTAVFWGLSAIVLFVGGLFAGLRAYRLTGLIGLVFCTAHIFIWDIKDTFYRIIAFFVIGLVMLAIGFLYHRFRERISALDS